MNELPGDPNLPPGFTEKPEPKECPECGGEGKHQCSPCCGDELRISAYYDELICARCQNVILKEDLNCSKCDGKGVIEDDPA